MAFKQYTKLDQLRNEYQWWLEQRMCAIQEGDFEYLDECDKTLKKLWADIIVEYRREEPTIVKEKTFVEKVLKFFKLG